MKSCNNCNKEVPSEFDICWNCNFNFITKEIEPTFSDKIDTNLYWVKPKKINCLRCRTTMTFEQTVDLHEGTEYGILGNLGHLFTKQKSFDIYICPNCDKIEFFAPTVAKKENLA